MTRRAERRRPTDRPDAPPIGRFQSAGARALGQPDTGAMTAGAASAPASSPPGGSPGIASGPESGSGSNPDSLLSYPSSWPTSLTGADRPEQATYVPLVDVIDIEDEVRVVVDTPGFDESDITIEVDEDVLIVTAEREEESTEDDRKSRVERPLVLERVVPLPTGLDVDDAWATYSNGTTTITFEKDDDNHHQIGFQ